jgi:creatinine amidohydrolase/Fe(II)-dependent formamide hydrolase-like protein
MRGCFLEDLTWDEAERLFKENRPVLIPVGAFAKEHGLHLPLDTDSVIARHLAGRVADELPVVIAPVIGFGYYPAFTDYPGSQHLRAETFIALVTDILAGFAGQGARRLAILNTGYSTEAPLRIAARTVLERCGIRVAIADLRHLGAQGRSKLRENGGHADAYETCSCSRSTLGGCGSTARSRRRTGRRPTPGRGRCPGCSAATRSTPTTPPPARPAIPPAPMRSSGANSWPGSLPN